MTNTELLAAATKAACTDRGAILTVRLPDGTEGTACASDILRAAELDEAGARGPFIDVRQMSPHGGFARWRFWLSQLSVAA
jgi:hypothetical protein